jgi:ketosteroid isomerase-like protein
MRPIASVLILAAAVACATPLAAQQLSVSALKAFMAKIDAATNACDVDTVIDHISELAILSGVGYQQGQMVRFRMNKSQYRELATRVCATTREYTNVRTNEKITIEGDQAIITADVAETMVLNGQTITTNVRERATVESIDGKLMLVQLVSNEVL